MIVGGRFYQLRSLGLDSAPTVLAREWQRLDPDDTVLGALAAGAEFVPGTLELVDLLTVIPRYASVERFDLKREEFKQKLATSRNLHVDLESCLAEARAIAGLGKRNHNIVCRLEEGDF